MNMRSEVLFVGGRSGVGKSSVAFELHAQLAALKVKHCVIEGDSLDLAFPH
jgi:2-phosphoglycerate kinase